LTGPSAKRRRARQKEEKGGIDLFILYIAGIRRKAQPQRIKRQRGRVLLLTAGRCEKKKKEVHPFLVFSSSFTEFRRGGKEGGFFRFFGDPALWAPIPTPQKKKKEEKIRRRSTRFLEKKEKKTGPRQTF